MSRFNVWRIVAPRLVGVVAALVILICANVLVSRFFFRWDVTSQGLFTPSDATTAVLGALEQPVEVICFLSAGDPLTQSVRLLLDDYVAQSSSIQPRFVDPDRNPAEFIALQRKYGMLEGRTDNGRLASEASIVVVSQERRWFITTDDIIVVDEDDGTATPRLEQVLTEGIANVVRGETVRACFTQGHGEPSLRSGGPQSLSELRAMLERSNFELEELLLGPAEALADTSRCGLVIVIGPTTPFSPSALEQLKKYRMNGGPLLLAVGPLVDDSGQILSTGFEKLWEGDPARPLGEVVFEQAKDRRLPVGIGGEIFLAEPRSHAITEGWATVEGSRYQVLMQLASPLHIPPESGFKPLLTTSKQSVAVAGFRDLNDSAIWSRAEEGKAERLVAGALDATGGRLVYVGSSSVAWPSTWRDPGLLGTRRWVENVIAWLVERAQLVSVPEKRGRPAGLSLTEASLAEVQRYVLFYLPAVVGLLGFLVVYRRRHELSTAKAES